MQLESLSWFPGHMTKTRRMVASEIGSMDAVCEIIDARIPRASRNPDLDDLTAGKPRIVVLNRVDQADPKATKQWAAWFRAQGYAVLEVDAKSGAGVKQFAPAVRALLADKLRAYEEKGQIGRVLRVMVLGIPNVGKSSLINRLAGAVKAKAADKPGVTRAKQWIKIGAALDLLDTPGILWPKFEDQTVGLKLAFTGAINDDIYDREQVTALLLSVMRRDYPERLQERFKFKGDMPEDGIELLEAIGRKRGCLVKGGVVDLEKAQNIVLTEFRSGKLGLVTLDEVPQSASTEAADEKRGDEA